MQLNVPARPAGGKPVGATEGTPFTAQVAWLQGIGTFDESGLYAIVSWGDGTTDSTEYSQANDGITFATDDGVLTAAVTGNHDYSEFGNYAVRTSFFLDGTEIALVDGPATVAHGSITLTVPTDQVFYAGVSGDWVVATFTISGGNGASDTALISYGDGTTTEAAVVPDSQVAGQFDVQTNEMHAYSESATVQLPFTVTVYDPSGASAQAEEPVTVLAGYPADTGSSTLDITPLSLQEVVNVPFQDAPLANVTETDVNNDYHVLMAEVTWQTVNGVPYTGSAELSYTGSGHWQLHLRAARHVRGPGSSLRG